MNHHVFNPLSRTITIIVAAALSFTSPLFAQTDSLATANADSAKSVPTVAIRTESSPVYHVYPKVELPAGLLALGISYLGFKDLSHVAAMTEDEVLALDPKDINSFDRPSAYLPLDNMSKMQKGSDWALNISVFSPILLGLDRSVRKDAIDLVAMYLMAHAFNDALYFSAAYSFRRPRPYVYSQNVPLAQRSGTGKTNSFYSGHVAFASTATFFLVKVYTDYHQIRGIQRDLLYLAASIPPATVGYFRYKGGKHFKSDVMLGFVVGAFTGIIVPTMHRWSKKHQRVSVGPSVQGGAPGLSFVYNLDK